MNDDGIALTSMAHPIPATRWKRFVSWLRCLRGIRNSSLLTGTIEYPSESLTEEIFLQKIKEARASGLRINYPSRDRP